MIDLFSTEGLEALARIARRTTLYAFDFDGTLAPIVERPDDARAAPSTIALLATLGTLVPTAILTGRSVDDLKQRLEFTPLHLVGNHGAEGVPTRCIDRSRTRSARRAATGIIARSWIAGARSGTRL